MKYKNFFYTEVPTLLSKLNNESIPSFGLMTAQHMVEHLIWITKASLKDFGPAPEELNKAQKGFMKFVKNGSKFEYRPSNKSIDDLAALKYENLDQAKSELPNAIDRLKDAITNKKSEEFFYNPMMGVLNKEEMESFHLSHYKWHLEKQFQLL